MCYSDHNEDIRTKGFCDYCGSDMPDFREDRLFDQTTGNLTDSSTDSSTGIPTENLGRLFD